MTELDISEAFNKNTQEILKQVVNIDLPDGNISTNSYTTLHDGIILMVGLSGVLSGQITINISNELAKLICSRLEGNIPIVELDDNFKKTVFKLCKLIIGNSCVSLYNNGVMMSVASYCIIEGYGLTYTSLDRDINIISYQNHLDKTDMLLIIDISERNKIC